jgi:SAM-dependent methyltransferase
LLIVLSGCLLREPKRDNLDLTLPESADPPRQARDRVSKLTIDGQDFSEPRAIKRSVWVAPAEGKKTVTVEYSFWPNSYTNILRTKVVTMPPGERVAADLTQEDPATPDRIKPIYVPTPHEVVIAMCKLGNVGPRDIVYDIGSGDGRLVVMAVKFFGAKKGVGVDIDNSLVALAWQNARRDEVQDKVEFRAGDALEIKDFSEASVVLLYVGDVLNRKLKPVLQKTLKPGSRVVSHRFLMGDDWPPEQSITIQAKNNYGDLEEYRLHLWTIK